MAESSDNFSTDPTARWAAVSGAVWTWDSANNEMDADAAVSRWAQRYTTDTGSIENEAQATFFLAGSAPTDQMGGGGGRIHGTNDDFYFPVASAINDTIILYKHVGGARTTLATFTGYTAGGSEWHTIRSAYSGAAGANVVINIWRTNHGTTKPADPGWYGTDGTPDHTYTDTAADRLDDATHLYNGIVGQGQGSDWDTQHSFYKQRAISDRSSGGTTIAIGAASANISGFVESLATQLPIGLGTFVSTGLVPSLSINVSIPINTGSLAVGGLSPTLSQILSLSAGSVSVQGFSFNLNKTISLTVGSLTVNGLTPSSQQSVVLNVSPGSIAITGLVTTFATTLSLSNSATISITGFSPNPTFVAQTVAIGAGSVTLSGRTPTAVISGVGIPQASVTISGLAASLANQISIGRVDILAQGFAPSLNHATAINVGQLAISGRIPTLQASVSNVAIGTGAVAVSGYVQTLIAGTPVINMVTGSMNVTGLVPGIEQLLLIRNTGSRSDNTLMSRRADTAYTSKRTST